MNYKESERYGFRKIISMITASVIAVSGLPSMVLADMLNAPSYYSVQSNLDYEISTNITSSWINHESIDLVLTNTGSETIHNWYLTFNTPYSIDNIWNGTIYETGGNGTYTITSNGWNQDIHTGEFVTVGITFSSDTEEDLSIDPEWYLLNTQETVVDASQYTLGYTEYSAWESGFTGQLTLTPQVDCQHWELSFGSNREITAVSSAVLLDEGDNNYTITHDENNMRLFTDTAYNFGIQGNSTVDPLNLSNVELTVVDLAYNLTDDEDNNGIPDYLELMGMGENPIEPTPTPTDVPTNTPTTEPTNTEIPTETPTDEPTETPTETPTDEPTETPTETVTPTEEPTPTIDPEADQDLDGIPDYIEIEIGTNPLKADTDDDGLSDLIEVMVGYDPTNPDTDGNGITDGNEDLDSDGLSNTYELQIGTELSTEDTDGDRLSDGDEVNTYGTDPLVPDSDGDSHSDGEEIHIGKNPLDPNDRNICVTQILTTTISNNEDPAITSVDITMDLPGDIRYVAYAEDLYNVDSYSTDVYGRIGSPIGLGSFEPIDNALVIIHYDETCLGETDEESLGVLWFDEQSGLFIVQDQAVVDEQSNTISLSLTHFSTYIVVDLEKWNNPVVPDYSENIMTVEDGTSSYFWHNEERDLDQMEHECFVWWKLSHGSQYQILQRLAGDMHCNDTSKILQEWYFNFTWLVMNNTDADEDGICDFFETEGIMGTNRHIYYSDPTMPDTDGDNVPDGEEYGDILVFANQEGSYVTNHTEISADYFPASTGYYYVFAKMRSHPDKQNSDLDDMNDFVDPYPRETKVDKIFILYENGSVANIDDARLFYDTYLNVGLNCELIGFCGANSFIDSWDRIGRKLITADVYTGDDYYNVTDVVVSAHGNNDYNCILLESNYSFLLPNNYNNADAIHVSDLSNKTIGSLHLRVCYLSVTDTACVTDIPTDFLIAFPSIDRVYAFDTNEFLVHCSDYYSISGGVSTVFNFMGGNTGIYAQVVYHRGSTCMGVSNIGSRSVDGTTIYYDNLYWNDQTYNYRDENGLQSEVRIWNNLYPYDPILDRIDYEK